jgi:hypothetical protein
MAKSALRLLAREMRKDGLGIKTIAHQLKVSSSTVSLWCRDIQLSQEQIHVLEKRMHDPSYGRRLMYTQKQRKEKEDRISKLFTSGIQDVGCLSDKELFVIGISLYWAEGFKKDSLVGFSNSDSDMIKIFLRWLQVCCNISKNRIKVRLGVNETYVNKTKEIEQYWSKQLHLSLQQFQKPYIQKVQWKKQYDNPNEYHGVLRIRVSKSIELLRRIHGWIEGLKRNG